MAPFAALGVLFPTVISAAVSLSSLLLAVRLRTAYIIANFKAFYQPYSIVKEERKAREVDGGKVKKKMALPSGIAGP